MPRTTISKNKRNAFSQMPAKLDTRIMMQSSSFSVAGGTAGQLLREYNRRLIQDLGMMTRREVKKKDIVDLRPILDLTDLPPWQAPPPDLGFNDKLYIADDYYYCYIPCFEEGVYHVNSDRYIYWKITDMDLAGHSMALWLQDFIYYAEGCGWQPGVYGDITWTFGDPEYEINRCFSEKQAMRCDYAAAPDSVTDYIKLYNLIDVKSLGWSASDLDAWDELVLKYAKMGCEAMLKKTGSHNLDSLAATFKNYTAKANRILTEHKLAGKSRPASKAEHDEYLAEKAKTDMDGQGTAKPLKERRIRIVGPIQVTSRTRPKPGRRAAANYKKAAWETRGHMRTLKSGKKVYVKKSVHHRKALINNDNNNAAPEKPTPLTIRLMPQNNKDKDGNKNEG